ncbi:NUDIX domain-containing protein [Cardinium endosymbiont of Culicoides punctatus]|uniref:NUDIX domain-containing protein n=1 Tax=Cardinium endosymbiont of Culicoides punctatus TaxID=2304601 RepID=UPI001058FD5A|nr:NUDIX domain-containing protein [Cardinium endosymbiont of Culicoides punctatus]TDG94670.1 hypothetical protein CCPUN_07660 [Cardinium endosymbiont of Culicoides punctatus]
MNRKQIVKVRGILESDGKILLCEHTKGLFYFLPGGTLEIGENLHQCLVREFFEETGLIVVVADFLGCLECHWEDDLTSYQELNMIFNVVTKDLSKLINKE